MPLQIYFRKNTPVSVSLLKRCGLALLKYAQLKNTNLEISLVGPKTMEGLNLQFRKKKQLTDVLSFPMDLKPPFKGVPWNLGEIVICTQVAKAQARQRGRTLNQQVLRLMVHGFVHLQNLDHEKEKSQAKKFLQQEQHYLKHLKQKALLSKLIKAEDDYR